ALDHGAVEHAGADADQTAALERATVDHRRVTDDDVVTDRQRMGLVGDVQHRAVLDVGARADADPVDVATRGDVEPERAVVARFEVAGQVGRRGKKHPLPQSRQLSLIWMDRHGALPWTLARPSFSARRRISQLPGGAL